MIRIWIEKMEWIFERRWILIKSCVKFSENLGYWKMLGKALEFAKRYEF